MKKLYFYFLLFYLSFGSILNAQDHTITLAGTSFSPNILTIQSGETVEFDNVAGFHNVNGTQGSYPGNPESFGSGSPAGAPWQFEYQFNTPGTYDYRCDPHFGIGMIGQIIVEGSISLPTLVITELMYNPPESGADSLEFIEIYNNGNESVDMSGYSMGGVTLTFENGTLLGAGEYLILAGNSDAVENAYGISGTIPWTGGALSNGGEAVSILDDNDNVIDMVTYDNGNGWPTGADSGGASLVLCDFDSDNSLATSWANANTSAGFSINGMEVFANPGTESNCITDPIISFENNATAVSEDIGTLSIQVNLENFNSNETQVMVVNASGSTATPGDDFNILNSTVTFEANSGTPFLLDIMINDDSDSEGDETIILQFANPTNGAIISNINNTFTINIGDNDIADNYTDYPIETVTEVDEMGIAVYNDSLVRIQGVVYGVNLRPSGLQFTVIDEENDGINLFLNEGNLDYVVNEGDEIIVAGEIGQFNGLINIVPDAIDFVDANNALFEPTVVTIYDESIESQLIRLEDVSLVDLNQWTGTGPGFNVDVTNGTNTYVVRIDNDIDLYSMEAPTGTFNVTGIGGQFDNEAPFDGGYQLLPRYVADIDPYNPNTNEPSYPEVEIGVITTINVQGVVDSLNRTYTIEGVVQSIDFRGGAGYQFFLHDDTGGISVFSLDDESYEVTKGDELIIQGKVTQFNGLAQLEPDNIEIASTGLELQEVVQVDIIGENTESEFVKIVVIGIQDIELNPMGSGYNVTLVDENSGSSYLVRIDNDSPLFDFNPYIEGTEIQEVIGFGSQFDTEVPFDDNYQLLAVEWESHLRGSTNNLKNQGKLVTISPNPANQYINLSTSSQGNIEDIRIYDQMGRLVLVHKNGNNEIDISTLAVGNYQIKAKLDGALFSKKLLIVR